MNEATVIDITVWKDPQNFIIVEHVRDEADVYFRCWNDDGNEADYIGWLHFDSVWYLQSERHLGTKGYPNVKNNKYKSYYLVVSESDLLKDLIASRSNIDSDWRKYDAREYQHYIIESHDFYYNIIASKIVFTELKDEAICNRMFKRWDEV